MILILLVTAVLFTVAKTWKQPTNMSINRWMDKEHVPYVFHCVYIWYMFFIHPSVDG